MQKGALAIGCAVLLPCLAIAGIEDMIVRFSTSGPDRYADGSIVADGECYALVWSPKGSVFSGFNADGTPASSNDRVVLAAPLAKDGKCPDAIFQVPAAEYAGLEGGEWAVCLVDTRTLGGLPVGVANNAPLRVNRWGAVKGGVKIEPVSVSSSTATPIAKGGSLLGASSGSVVRATKLSAVPAGLKPPRITALDVGDDEVWLAVEDTVPFISYTIVSGSEPGNLKADYFSGVVDGNAAGEVAIGTLKSATRRFFRVARFEE